MILIFVTYTPIHFSLVFECDVEYYKINGKYYDIEAIQDFLVKALKVPCP